MNTFLADLNSVPWHVIENEEDIDHAVFIWNQLFSEIADLHAPLKGRRVRGVPLPWLNDKISEAMKDRDFHYREAVKTNSDFHWACNVSWSRVLNTHLQPLFHVCLTVISHPLAEVFQIKYLLLLCS